MAKLGVHQAGDWKSRLEALRAGRRRRPTPRPSAQADGQPKALRRDFQSPLQDFSPHPLRPTASCSILQSYFTPLIRKMPPYGHIFA
jgi:hypothetical protein